MKMDPQNKVEKISDDVRIITPRHVLREKAGYGGVDNTTVKRAQHYADQLPIEFEPYAKDFLERLQAAIHDARKNPTRDKTTIATLSRPAMDLKANGGMYKYPLVTSLADILLNFLEHLPDLNDDAIEVVDLHLKTITAIMANRLSGDGGAQGKALAGELYGACLRYMKKHKGLKD